MEHQIDLQQLVSFVMKGLTAEACSRQSLLVNDVNAGVTVRADRESLAATLNEVLTKTICHTSNNCIRIGSATYDNIISLVITHSSRCTSTSIAVSMELLQEKAERLGGSITVVSDSDSRIMVALSFYNGLRAA